MKYLWEKLYCIIENSGPDGISTNDLLKKLKTTRSSVYSQVNLINKKPGYNRIVNKGGVYFLSNEKKGEYISQRKSIQNIKNPDLSDIIPQRYLKIIPNLSETDRADLLDMIKKSFFYKLTAIALLEAHNLTSGFNQ